MVAPGQAAGPGRARHDPRLLPGRGRDRPPLLGLPRRPLPARPAAALVPAWDVRLMAAAYAELQVTTNFSFLRGGSHPEELVETAILLGLSAIAVTDRNSLAGI